MSYYIVFGFLVLSLVLYCVTGGADFGVGILELFSRSKKRVQKHGEHAIAPIWEANHVWIIVAIVILFIGFPKIHAFISTFLHIPILLMLAGIILRGTAFTFRYYDVGEEQDHRGFTIMFTAGSLLVPLTFGHIVAAMSRGKFPVEVQDVTTAYIEPWFGWFPFLCGCFVAAMFAWIASVFLIGDVAENDKPAMIGRFRRSSAAMLSLGFATTVAAWFDGVSWLTFDWKMIAFGVGATISFAGTWLCLETRPWIARFMGGGTIALVVIGYWASVFPVAVQHTPELLWTDTAPKATLDGLAIALVVAALLVIPSLIWLYSVFKSAPESENIPNSN